MRYSNIAFFIPHLGCPYKCLFCDQNRISKSGLAPSPSDIPHLIERHLSTLDQSQTKVELAFFGGSFTALPLEEQKSYLAAAQPYLNKGLLQGIRLSTRPDCIDLTVLDFLKEWGVTTIELGIQSFDDRVLNLSGREYNSLQALEACHLVKQENFTLGLQLMIGLPGDEVEAVYRSTRIAISLNPDLVRIYPTLVVKGTGLEDMLIKGTFRPLSLKQAVEISKEMYIAFQSRDIPVVRIGLHPGEELRRPGVVVSGPYHPSFGELVKQAVFKEQAIMLIRDLTSEFSGSDEVLLLVNKRDLSKMIGHRKRNLLEIKEAMELEQLSVKWREDIRAGEIGALLSGRCERRLGREDFFSRRNDPVNARQGYLY